MNVPRTLMLMVCAMIGFASHANAGSTRCMSRALNHVMMDFERAKNAEGIVARDAKADYDEINLGTNIEVRSIEVVDISKNAYRINIRLDYVDNRSSDRLLRATVDGVDYETCTLRKSERVTYTLF